MILFVFPPSVLKSVFLLPRTVSSSASVLHSCICSSCLVSIPACTPSIHPGLLFRSVLVFLPQFLHFSLPAPSGFALLHQLCITEVYFLFCHPAISVFMLLGSFFELETPDTRGHIILRFFIFKADLAPFFEI